MVHPRDNELVVATHGRSIYVIDVKPWQKLSAIPGLKVYDPQKITHSEQWGERRYAWSKLTQPSMDIWYFIAQDGDEVEVDIVNEQGNTIRSLTASGKAGFHKVTWDLQSIIKKRKASTKQYVPAGTYQAKFSRGDIQQGAKIEVSPARN